MLRFPKWLRLLYVMAFAGCGGALEEGTGRPFGFALERSATNSRENFLLLDLPRGAYLFSVDGHGFTASVEKGKLTPIKERVALKAEALGTHDVNVVIAHADGTRILSDTLMWEYDHEVPPMPIVGFS